MSVILLIAKKQNQGAIQVSWTYWLDSKSQAQPSVSGLLASGFLPWVESCFFLKGHICSFLTFFLPTKWFLKSNFRLQENWRTCKYLIYLLPRFSNLLIFYNIYFLLLSLSSVIYKVKSKRKKTKNSPGWNRFKMYGPFTVLSRKDQYPKCKWVAMPRIYSITYPQVQACLEWLQLPGRDEFVLWKTFDSIQRHAWLPWWRLGIMETTSRGCRCYRHLTATS